MFGFLPKSVRMTMTAVAAAVPLLLGMGSGNAEAHINRTDGIHQTADGHHHHHAQVKKHARHVKKGHVAKTKRTPMDLRPAWAKVAAPKTTPLPKPRPEVAEQRPTQSLLGAVVSGARNFIAHAKAAYTIKKITATYDPRVQKVDFLKAVQDAKLTTLKDTAAVAVAIAAQADVECGGKVDCATGKGGHAGPRGFLQIQPQTQAHARAIAAKRGVPNATKLDRMKPQDAAVLVAVYLDWVASQTDGTLRSAIIGYNWGPENAKRVLARNPQAFDAQRLQAEYETAVAKGLIWKKPDDTRDYYKRGGVTLPRETLAYHTAVARANAEHKQVGAATAIIHAGIDATRQLTITKRFGAVTSLERRPDGKYVARVAAATPQYGPRKFVRQRT